MQHQEGLRQAGTRAHSTAHMAQTSTCRAETQGKGWCEEVMAAIEVFKSPWGGAGHDGAHL